MPFRLIAMASALCHSGFIPQAVKSVGGNAYGAERHQPTLFGLELSTSANRMVPPSFVPQPAYAVATKADENTAQSAFGRKMPVPVVSWGPPQ